MFEKITLAPADPILGLTEAFAADTRDHKINLGVGVYKDEAGTTPILASVKKAEALLLEAEKTKSYLGIQGLPEYGKHVQKLLFGTNSAIISDNRARTAQAPGGTGALRIAADFAVRHLNATTIWVSNPTWANHQAVFKAAGLTVEQYNYYNAEIKDLDFGAMLESLKEVKAGDLVLFHGCCHNPTGIDPTAQQWQTLAELSAQNGWLPLFDFAYQGFANGIEEDAQGLRTFLNNHSELLIASSFSKNFGLYNERTGAFTLVAANADVADTAFSQVKVGIRSMYSNPPAHGAKVVSTILGNEELYKEWVEEVAEMRVRIHEMRTLFVETLAAKGVKGDFSFIQRQNGMFSFSGLTKAQVEQLKEEYGVYIVGSGRISVAGMTKANMDALCEGIAGVLK